MKIQKIEELYFQGQRLFPVALRLKPFPTDAVALFRRMRTRYSGEAAFFETADGVGFSQPCLTLMGFQPSEKIRIVDGKVEVQRDGQSTIRPGEVTEILREILREVGTAAIPELPFFQGGLLGYFGYECARFFEQRLRGHGTFAAAARSSDPDAELSLFHFYLVVDHASGQAFALSLLDLREKSCVLVADLLDRKIEDLRLFAHAAEEMSGPARPPSKAEPVLPRLFPPKLPVDDQKFFANVKRLKEHIRAGDLFQAVLSERIEIAFNDEPLATFEKLRELSPAPYRFFYESDGRTFLGASPEKLASLHDGVIETHPIAGTRPRGITPADDHRLAQQLRTSRKEAAEHLMLVDLARNDIGRVSQAGSVRVSTFRQIVKYAAVQHLVSKVEGRLKKNLTALDALIANFPAGTLSGAPKIRAMQILSELEARPRGFYGGGVVALSLTGAMDSCIAIRALEIHDGKAILRAGAGIVADSQPAREADEIRRKMASLRRVLGFVDDPVPAVEAAV